MEKYNDIIKNLIKENKRYSGCEEILDDIVEEVWAKSKGIIDSVENESIVISYIERMVNIAMVTVPKRMNLKTRSSKHIQIPAEESVVDDEPTNLVNNEVTPLSISDEEVPVQLDEVLEQDVDEGTLLEDQSPEEPITGDEIEILPPPEETEESLIEPASEESAVELEDLTENFEPEVNKDLVDRVINGVSLDEEENVDELLDDDNVESIELLEDSTSEDDLGESEKSDIEESDLIEELNNPFEEDDSLLIKDDNDEMAPEISNDMLEEVTPESDEAETLVEDEVLLEENSSLDEELRDTEDDFNLPDLSCFEGNAEKEEVDLDYISKQLLDLAAKQENTLLMNIFELKYCKNKSVSEIADILEIDTKDVLSALEKIMDIVEV